MDTHNQRDGFSSAFGMLAATLGSAVGLGNIWMFPYQVGMGGGAGFLLIYLLATLLVGLPLMIAEISMGRYTHRDSITTYRQLAPGSLWWLTALVGIAATLLIMSFYTVVVGWVFAYVGKSLTGSLHTADKSVLQQQFGELVGSAPLSLGWQWLVLLVVGLILGLGVTRGIEAVTKRLMPVLFVLLLIIAGVSLTLPNAMAGVKFLFLPQWGNISAQTVLAALGLAFFKLSVGVGTMTIYGSYFKESQNIPKTALTVMLADLAVSLLAGLAIFPAVFSFGFDPKGGPSLLFQTLPAVMQKMPFGSVLLTLFFVLTALAAIGAMLSLLEVPVAAMNEGWGIPRRRAAWLAVAMLFVLGLPCALSNNLLQSISLSGKTIFDLFDFLSSKILMPMGGLLICLFVALRWQKPAFTAENTNHGRLNNQAVVGMAFGLLRSLTPLLIIIIMLTGLLL